MPYSLNQFSVNSFTRNTGVAVFAITLMLLLHACGFQLRGAVNLSQDMSPVYVEKNGIFDLAREIRDVLTSNGIKTVDNAGKSKSQLILLNESKTRRVLSVDGDGRAREYLLIYTVNFEIKRKLSADEKTESKQDMVSMSRALLFEPDAVLAAVNESEIIYKDMRRETARLILLKLQGFSTQMEHAEKAGVASDSGSNVSEPKTETIPAATESNQP